MGGLFAAILYTTNTKTTKKRHGVTQKADGINTIPVKHPNSPAAFWQSPAQVSPCGGPVDLDKEVGEHLRPRHAHGTRLGLWRRFGVNADGGYGK